MTAATLATKVTRRPAPLTRQIRDLHAYVGALIAPSILFFSATGIIQVYGLHEAHLGYTPPPVIEKLGMLHKNQRFTLGRHRAPPATKPPLGAPKPAPDRERPTVALLKAYFALVAIGLFVSTLAGMWMALRQSPQRRVLAVLLVIGAVTPIVLAALTA
jgi:hypothetical protein